MQLESIWDLLLMLPTLLLLTLLRPLTCEALCGWTASLALPGTAACLLDAAEKLLLLSGFIST